MTHLRTHWRTMANYAKAERRYTKASSLRFEKTLAHREERANARALVAEGLDELLLPLHPLETRTTRAVLELELDGNPLLIAMKMWLEQEQSVRVWRRREFWAPWPGFDPSIDTELAAMMRLCCTLTEPAHDYDLYGDGASVYLGDKCIGYFEFGYPTLVDGAFEIALAYFKQLDQPAEPAHSNQE